MASNGIYNYNNYVMGDQKYNSANENGINMSLVAKGRFYESMESAGENYYGVSYTAEMQKQGKIGVPDKNTPGGYRIVDVDSREGKSRLRQLEKERDTALAELKKFNEFRHPSVAGNTAATAAPSQTQEAETGRHGNRRHHRRDYDVASFDMDKIKEMKADMKGNLGAYKQMVYKQAKTQASYADPTLAAMLKGVTNLSPGEAAKAVAEDGEWGVEATANRILDFAKAISGGDPEKIGLLKDAVMKGFKAAEKVWGGALPGISQQTLQRVMDGFDEWEKSGSAAEAQTPK